MQGSVEKVVMVAKARRAALRSAVKSGRLKAAVSGDAKKINEESEQRDKEYTATPNRMMMRMTF